MSRIALSLVLAAVLGACASEDIPLAQLPAREAGTGDTRCVDDTDCPVNAFCSMSACDALAGTCEVLPALCSADPDPVCGCDGVTYWNDCLRRVTRVRAATRGQCPPGATVCGGPRPCREGAFCARLHACGAEVPGSCWVLPSVCPPLTGGGDRFVACGPQPGPCVDACTAIRRGQPHARAVSCP